MISNVIISAALVLAVPLIIWREPITRALFKFSLLSAFAFSDWIQSAPLRREKREREIEEAAHQVHVNAPKGRLKADLRV